MNIGQNVEGKGVYFGIWQPKDFKGNNLGPVFNLYAAPENSPHFEVNSFGEGRYRRHFHAVSGLKNWHGHDGSLLFDEENIHNAIRSMKLNELGRWFIPPMTILLGSNNQKDNLFDHRNKGALKDTFANSDMGHCNIHYVSSSVFDDSSGRYYFSPRFFAPDNLPSYKFYHYLRPVRLELV